MKNRRLRLAIGIAISLLCLFLLVRNIDWAKLWQTFSTANYWFLLPALLEIFGISWARAQRWRLLMEPEDRPPLASVFNIVNIGYLFNNLLPAKVGELVRAYLIGRRISGGFAQALSTLLVERLLDVICVVLLLVILIPFVALPAWAVRGGLIFGLVSLAGVIVLVVLAYFGERGLDWLWKFIGRLPVIGTPKGRAALSNLLAGLHVLTQVRRLPGLVLWSAVVWGGYALFNYTLMAAFHLALPFASAAFVLVATGFGMVVPSSPGAMGVFEGAAVLALSLYGVESSLGFAYAFGLHMYTNLALIAFGFVSLGREGVTFGQLQSDVATQQPASPKPSDD